MITRGRTAAVLVDMQEDVVHGPWFSWWPPTDGVVDACVQLVAACRDRGVPVIQTAVEYEPDGSNMPHASPPYTPAPFLHQNTPGVAIVPQLRPAPGELVAVKNLISGFDAAGFVEALKKDEIETIILGGIALKLGVLFTARDAHARGLNIVLVPECCSGKSAASFEEHLTDVYPSIATVKPLAEVLDEL